MPDHIYCPMVKNFLAIFFSVLISGVLVTLNFASIEHPVENSTSPTPHNGAVLAVHGGCFLGLEERNKLMTGALENGSNHDGIDLVVAYFNEDLHWLNEVVQDLQRLDRAMRVFVYSKHHDTLPDYVNLTFPGTFTRLKNVGREGGSYMHHIIHNYGALGSCTIFAQAAISSSAYGGLKRRKLNYVLKNLHRCAQEGVVGMASERPGEKIVFDPNFELTNFQGTTGDNYAHGKAPTNDLNLADPRPMGEWYSTWLAFDENSVRIRQTGLIYNSIFAASRKAIEQHPIKTFMDIQRQLLAADNTEVGHFLERAYLAMFATNKSEYMTQK
mmetsp:Transcript_48803/g.110757  ORF Transcript_48803/g.110757 Transcript_48803/m.110757 type:complete len:328 (-) Transcript_48803:303-1286(-)